MALTDLRDFQGSLGDAQAYYAAAQAQYQTSLKGPYVQEGRTYTPPPPEKIREELAYWANQILRLQTIQPNGPDLGMIQASFDGAPTRPPFRGGWPA